MGPFCSAVYIAIGDNDDHVLEDQLELVEQQGRNDVVQLRAAAAEQLPTQGEVVHSQRFQVIRVQPHDAQGGHIQQDIPNPPSTSRDQADWAGFQDCTENTG